MTGRGYFRMVRRWPRRLNRVTAPDIIKHCPPRVYQPDWSAPIAIVSTSPLFNWYDRLLPVLVLSFAAQAICITFTGRRKEKNAGYPGSTDQFEVPKKTRSGICLDEMFSQWRISLRLQFRSDG